MLFYPGELYRLLGASSLNWLPSGDRAENFFGNIISTRLKYTTKMYTQVKIYREVVTTCF
jgi:hypothetical protein